MAVERRYMNRINGWVQVAAGVNANPEEAKHLQPGSVRLEGLHKEATELSVEQAALTTAKQEVTKKLQRVLREGDALADFIRTGARAHFGADSEKMIEFGMQPFRGRKLSPEAKARRAEAKAEKSKAKAPETETSAPDTVK